MVETIYKRYRTRSMLKISGLGVSFPMLSRCFIVNILITIGLPGSSIFLLKFIFLSNIVMYSIYVYLLIAIIFLFILPIFFIRLYLCINSGIVISNINKKGTNTNTDITRKELIILIIPAIINIVFGFIPNLIL